MKIIKVGKYTVVRHWFRWYWINQANGGSAAEHNWLTPIHFTKEIE